MSEVSALVGRDDLVSEVVREIRKGKQLVLTGPVGIGKSAVIQAALKRIEPRPSKWYQFDPVANDAGELEVRPAELLPEDPGRKDCVLVYLSEHQAKGQFVQMARRLVETGILKPSSLDLAKKYDDMPSREIEWTQIRRHVDRLSIRDLTAAIIPAIYAYEGCVLIAVEDMTRPTPTMGFNSLSIVAGVLNAESRYLAIGLGATALSVMAGSGAALFLASRFVMLRGSSRKAA